MTHKKLCHDSWKTNIETSNTFVTHWLTHFNVSQYVVLAYFIDHERRVDLIKTTPDTFNPFFTLYGSINILISTLPIDRVCELLDVDLTLGLLLY